MPLFQALVLGVIQGLTEFLPISSTAHLVLIPRLLGWPDHSLTFDIALHAGTLAAVLVYFFRDWVQIFAQGFGMRFEGSGDLKRNPRLLWLLAAGSVPIGVAGYFLQRLAETAWRGPYVIASAMIGVGLFMWFAESAGRRQRDISTVTVSDAVSIGLGQALAVVPGVSRSGITISAALLRNLDRRAAARFSFLLSTPAVAAAAAKDFWDLMRHQGGIPPDVQTAFVAGIAASAITGFLAIGWLLNFLRTRSLSCFVIYRIVFGIIVIALAVFRYGGG